ncbi:MAG TPA: YbhB/YbcL family Raf kinase inhibitor-like protein [Anaeromyxobacteraceae bacterium]|nr:YbhB/YbcL family Raf kinase inhibitor-like protein [Anaeromyxobacteraceae bacterium]
MRTILLVTALTLASPALAAGRFTLTSTDVKPGMSLSDQQVFNGFGCAGANVSPELSWANAPKDSKSFVVTVYDPDAPTGSGWWHWVVFNIPATATGLAQGAGSGKAALPEGAVQGRTDFGPAGFGGACPPPGDKPHRYVFTVYALKVEKLDLGPDASPAMVGFMTKANALGNATFTARYSRKK